MHHPLSDTTAEPKSIYRDTAAEAPKYDRLADAVTADVAIVGGGLMGLSATLHAAERGLKVVLLEAREIGWGSAGRNQGQVVPALRQEPAKIIAKYGAEKGKPFSEAIGADPDVVFGIIEKYGLQCEAARKGIITAAPSPVAFEALRGRANYWIERGQKLDVLSRSDATRLIGTNFYIGGVLDHRGGSINPLSYVRELSRTCVKLGVRIFVQSEVTELKQTRQGWQLKTAIGSVTAPRVLLFTNAYSKNLWPGIYKSVVPVRAHQLISKPLSDNVRKSILPYGQPMSDTRRMMIGVRMHPDGRLQTGGASAMTGPEGPPQFDRVKRRLKDVFPQLGDDFDWESEWSGWFAMTPDYFPRFRQLHRASWLASDAMAAGSRSAPWSAAR